MKPIPATWICLILASRAQGGVKADLLRFALLGSGREQAVELLPAARLALLLSNPRHGMSVRAT